VNTPTREELRDIAQRLHNMGVREAYLIIGYDHTIPFGEVVENYTMSRVWRLDIDLIVAGKDGDY